MSLKRKVLVSMLAVGLVLGSFALIGPNNTYFSSSVAYAADSVQAYKDRVVQLYGNLSTTDKKTIDDARKEIALITSAEWDVKLASITKNETQAKLLLTDMLALVIPNASTVDDNVDSFKNTFETIFVGASVNDLFAYVNELESAVTNVTFVSNNLSNLPDAIKGKAVEIKSKSTYSSLDGLVFDQFGIGVDGLYSISLDIYDGLDNKSDVLGVIVRAVLGYTPPGNGGGDGGGSTTPPPTTGTPTTPTTSGQVPVTEKVETNAAGQTTNTVSVKAEDVLKQAQDSKEPVNLVLKASKDADVVTAALPSDLVNKLNVGNPNHAVTLETPVGSVSLPVAALSQVLANAAGQGIDAVNAQVNLVVEKVSEADRKAFVEQLGSDSQVLTGLVQTKIVITSGDKTYEVKVYTDYVTNTVIIDGIHNANQLVGVSYSGSQGAASKEQTFAIAATAVGQASALPTIVKHENGKTVVTMMTRTNAPFTVVKTNKKFSDVTNQWFAADVTLLANKLLINGVTEGVYAPNKTLTRAEFAAMLVRALGLPEDVDASAEFSDVLVTDWFAGYVGAASSAGIIQGKGNGKFDPKGSVTRQEVAKMVVAAVEFASKKSVTANSAALAKFSDADQVSSWALDAVKFAAEKEILKGSNGKINPTSTATRAEAAAFIKRFLSEVGFISE